MSGEGIGELACSELHGRYDCFSTNGLTSVWQVARRAGRRRKWWHGRGGSRESDRRVDVAFRPSFSSKIEKTSPKLLLCSCSALAMLLNQLQSRILLPLGEVRTKKELTYSCFDVDVEREEA